MLPLVLIILILRAEVSVEVHGEGYLQLLSSSVTHINPAEPRQGEKIQQHDLHHCAALLKDGVVVALAEEVAASK